MRSNTISYGRVRVSVYGCVFRHCPLLCVCVCACSVESGYDFFLLRVHCVHNPVFLRPLFISLRLRRVVSYTAAFMPRVLLHDKHTHTALPHNAHIHTHTKHKHHTQKRNSGASGLLEKMRTQALFCAGFICWCCYSELNAQCAQYVSEKSCCGCLISTGSLRLKHFVLVVIIVVNIDVIVDIISCQQHIISQFLVT